MKISFPHLADYSIPITTLLESLFPDADILSPPPITKRTLELGARHSPDLVCAPFKYNLGNFIEALDAGADILIQAGGGCRFGFYGELQEQILKDLGYQFTFVKLINAQGLSFKKLHETVKTLGGRSEYPRLVYALLFALKTIKLMDEIDFYVRENIGFQTEKNAFENLLSGFRQALADARTFRDLKKIRNAYTRDFLNVRLSVPEDAIKVGLIGELYDVMEPAANFYIEKELAKKGVSVSRFINADYLLFQPKNLEKETVKAARPYLKYAIGADGTFNIAKSLCLAKDGFDGIIHIKPFGCTPEMNAMPVLYNVSRDYNIPILYLTFDALTTDTGVKTRLEAFYDMLKLKKQKEFRFSV